MSIYTSFKWLLNYFISLFSFISICLWRSWSVLLCIYLMIVFSETLDSLLQQENMVIEFWTVKKKKLEQCHQYVLFEQSAKQVSPVHTTHHLHTAGNIHTAGHLHTAGNVHTTDNLYKAGNIHSAGIYTQQRIYTWHAIYTARHFKLFKILITLSIFCCSGIGMDQRLRGVVPQHPSETGLHPAGDWSPSQGTPWLQGSSQGMAYIIYCLDISSLSDISDKTANAQVRFWYQL